MDTRDFACGIFVVRNLWKSVGVLMNVDDDDLVAIDIAVRGNFGSFIVVVVVAFSPVTGARVSLFTTV